MPKPIERTDDLAAELCARMAEGRSLKEICEADDMPSLRTVQRWLKTDREFCELYDRARNERAFVLADEIIEISDEAPLVIEHRGEKLEVKFDHAAILRTRSVWRRACGPELLTSSPPRRGARVDGHQRAKSRYGAKRSLHPACASVASHCISS
jgi:hypothetical protein